VHCWSCDFLQVYDLLFRPLFDFFCVELGSRRVMHIAVTRSPSSAWVTQRLREATGWGEGPRVLIRDHDDKFGGRFDAVAGLGIPP
jgi:putative transposase